MKIIKTPFPGVLVIEPDVFRDDRGFFFESYNQKRYEEAGIPHRFVQDNHSFSKKGVLRGLHAQIAKPQGKLVRAMTGEIFDVVVDIRKDSPTYKKWFSMRLSASNFKEIWVPAGYAHGFYTLSETADVEYKVTDFYDPTGQVTLLWNDPDIAIQWPSQSPLLSPKDLSGLSLKKLEPHLPMYQP